MDKLTGRKVVHFQYSGDGYLCAMIKVYLGKKISRRVVEGHPWIFNNEIDRVEGEVNGGETVTVFTHDKKFVGKGYSNPKSQITIRLLSRQKNIFIKNYTKLLSRRTLAH